GAEGQLGDVLLALSAGPIRVVVPTIRKETATEKLHAGAPLLRGEPVDVDWLAAQRRLQDVVAALAQRRADAAPPLARAVRSGKLVMAGPAPAALPRQPEKIHQPG